MDMCRINIRITFRHLSMSVSWCIAGVSSRSSPAVVGPTVKLQQELSRPDRRSMSQQASPFFHIKSRYTSRAPREIDTNNGMRRSPNFIECLLLLSRLLKSLHLFSSSNPQSHQTTYSLLFLCGISRCLVLNMNQEWSISDRLLQLTLLKRRKADTAF